MEESALVEVYHLVHDNLAAERRSIVERLIIRHRADNAHALARTAGKRAYLRYVHIAAFRTVEVFAVGGAGRFAVAVFVGKNHTREHGVRVGKLDFHLTAAPGDVDIADHTKGFSRLPLAVAVDIGEDGDRVLALTDITGCGLSEIELARKTHRRIDGIPDAEALFLH